MPQDAMPGQDFPPMGGPKTMTEASMAPWERKAYGEGMTTAGVGFYYFEE